MRVRALTLLTSSLCTTALLLAGCGSSGDSSSSTPAPVASASDTGGVAAEPVACLPDCSKQDLRGATFSRVNLDNARFVDADLTGARFEDIKATGVSFAGGILTNATFSLVDFSATDCTSGSYGEPKCKSTSDMRSRWYPNTTFDRSDFTGATFKGSLMEGVTFRDSTFD